MDIERIYYEHDSNCSRKNFTEVNAKGLKTCRDCAGIFDEKGKGVCVTDKKFDSWRENEIPDPES